MGTPGTKKPVVMGEDLGTPGGPATLDADGLLAESQRPSADALGAADKALSNLPDPATALWNLGAKPGERLLINADFRDPIDQRGGYVVPPDTPYYSDTGLTTQAGTVSAYTKALPFNGTCGIITVNSTTYYVAWSAAVRGYTGTGYTIDRWYSENPVSSLIVDPNGLLLRTDPSSPYSAFYQLCEQNVSAMLAGKTVTVSALFNDGHLACATKELHASEITENYAVYNGVGFGFIINPNDRSQIGRIITETSTYIPIKAAKLEFGDHQTLAHQDADGNWVLNDPPPNKALELLKCQRYCLDITPQIVFNPMYSGQLGANCAWFQIPLPVSMRQDGAMSFIGDPAHIQVAVSSQQLYFTPTSVSVLQISPAAAAIKCVFEHSLAEGTPCDFRKTTDSAKFMITKEL